MFVRFCSKHDGPEGGIPPIFFAMPKDRYVNATHSLVKFIGFDKFWCQNRVCTYDSDTNTPPNIKLDERVRVVSA